MDARLIALALCLTLALPFGCTGEAPGPASTNTGTPADAFVSPVPQPTPTVSYVPTPVPSTAHPAGVQTGVALVDRVLEAVESRQASRISDLLQFFSWPCSRAPQSGGILGCRDGEPHGAESMVVAQGGCEGGFMRQGEADERVNLWLQQNSGGVHAVAEVQVDPQLPFLGGFVIVYANGQALEVGAEGITYLNYGCGDLNGEDVVQDLRGSRKGFGFLLPPP